LHCNTESYRRIIFSRAKSSSTPSKFRLHKWSMEMLTTFYERGVSHRNLYLKEKTVSSYIYLHVWWKCYLSRFLEGGDSFLLFVNSSAHSGAVVKGTSATARFVCPLKC
jgi:hypothetical protein